jgi:hypothetical protein
MDHKFTFLPLAAMLMLPIASVDAAPRRGEQNDARAQMMAGKVKSLRSIENRILPRMKGSQYLGPEFDPAVQVYRLKFIRDGRVVFIDVDGRTGAILKRSR